MRAVDQHNTARLEQIVAELGWPLIPLVGVEASRAAWLLVQHADAEPAFQQEVLVLMEPFARSGQVASQDYAYLWDRTHEQQRFGTQGRCLPNGAFELFAMEDPDQFDVHRAAFHMPPLASDLELANRVRSAPPGADNSSGPTPDRGAA